MKLPNLLFRFVVMAAIYSCAAEVRSGGRGEVDRDASAPLLSRTLYNDRGQSMNALQNGANRQRNPLAGHGTRSSYRPPPNLCMTCR